MWIVYVIAILIAIKIYSKFTTGRCTSKACLVGKTALVTGGNSGIGYQTVLALAARGCRVIIADKTNCERTKEKIIQETGNKNIVIKHFDLASLTSVRALAKDINETEEKLDILINNAGSVGLGNSYTEDGLHLEVQVNHFGPFLLTRLLIGLLKRSAPSRIIFVSSFLAFFGRKSPKELNSPAGQFMTYANSKLCSLVTANEFARRLRGTGVTANSLHPGMTYTAIFENYAFGVGKPKWLQIFTHILNIFVLRPFCKSPEEGAQTSIHLAVSNEVEKVTGEHFWDCGVFWCQPYGARNPGYCKEIWEATEELVKISPEDKM